MWQDRSCTDDVAVENHSGGFCGQTAVLQLIYKTSLWNLLDTEKGKELSTIINKMIHTKRFGPHDCVKLPDLWNTKYKKMHGTSYFDQSSDGFELISSFLETYGGVYASPIFVHDTPRIANKELSALLKDATSTARWSLLRVGWPPDEPVDFKQNAIHNLREALELLDSVIQKVKKLKTGVVIGGLLCQPEHTMSFVVCNQTEGDPTYRLFNWGESLTGEEAKEAAKRDVKWILKDEAKIFCKNDFFEINIIIDKIDDRVWKHKEFIDAPIRVFTMPPLKISYTESQTKLREFFRDGTKPDANGKILLNLIDSTPPKEFKGFRRYVFNSQYAPMNQIILIWRVGGLKENTKDALFTHVLSIKGIPDVTEGADNIPVLDCTIEAKGSNAEIISKQRGFFGEKWNNGSQPHQITNITCGGARPGIESAHLCINMLETLMYGRLSDTYLTETVDHFMYNETFSETIQCVPSISWGATIAQLFEVLVAKHLLVPSKTRGQFEINTFKTTFSMSINVTNNVRAKQIIIRVPNWIAILSSTESLDPKNFIEAFKQCKVDTIETKLKFPNYLTGRTETQMYEDRNAFVDIILNLLTIAKGKDYNLKMGNQRTFRFDYVR